MVDINQMLNFHLGGGKARKEVKLLKREVAHYRAISDITDRVSGSNEVYYETFDMTNNMSVGKIDLATSTIEGVVVSDPSLFKVGQEVTIHNGEEKEVRIITNIEGDTFTFNEVPTLEGIICRSMAKIEGGKLHLDPPNMLEHDIRLNIQLEGEEKAYTIVSWVEQETPMNLENYESTVEDTYVPPVFEEGSEE